MTKIKLSLPTGNSVEKSLLSAFSVGEKKYVVMDAESVGSMGLPIILVSAFSGEKLSKIIDQNEWTSVKEALKSIISGGNVQYINIPQNLTADEIFYNQLTLPLASFDVLKNSYKPQEVEMNPAPVGGETLFENNASQEAEPSESVVVSNSPIEQAPAPVLNEQHELPERNSTDAVVNPLLADMPAENSQAINNNVQTTKNTNNTVMPDSTGDILPNSVSPEPSNIAVESNSPLDNMDVPNSNMMPIEDINNSTQANTDVLNNISPDSQGLSNSSSVVETPKDNNDNIETLKKEFLLNCEKMFDEIVSKIKSNN